MGLRKPILLVDDDRDLALTLSVIFERAGYLLLHAESGREGLEMLRRGIEPAVILLDVQMPDMSGGEFQARKMVDRRFAALPVIIMTGDPRSVDQVPIPGIWGYLVKPPDSESLLAAVGRFYAQPAAALSP